MRNRQDDVIVLVGADAYIASGKLGKNVKVASATLDGQVATIKGVQRESDETTNPWRASRAASLSGASKLPRALRSPA